MPTNSELEVFYDTLNNKLKPNLVSNNFVIEEDEGSTIKKLHIKKSGDIFIIRQVENNCDALKGIFKGEALKSCDFIAIINKNGNYRLFFCEMKSSKNKENIQKAYMQIENSKIFFNYVLKSYNLNYGKQLFIRDNCREVFIYPKINGIHQKSSTNLKPNHGLIFKQIEQTNGCSNIDKDFFNDIWINR